MLIPDKKTKINTKRGKKIYPSQPGLSLKKWLECFERRKCSSFSQITSFFIFSINVIIQAFIFWTTSTSDLHACIWGSKPATTDRLLRECWCNCMQIKVMPPHVLDVILSLMKEAFSCSRREIWGLGKKLAAEICIVFEEMLLGKKQPKAAQISK